MLPVDQSSAPEMTILRMATEGILGVMVQQVMVLSYQALLLSNSYSSVSPISMPLGGTVHVQEEQFPSDAPAPCLSNAGNTPRAAKCSRGGEQKACEHPPARCWHKCGCPQANFSTPDTQEVWEKMGRESQRLFHVISLSQAMGSKQKPAGGGQQEGRSPAVIQHSWLVNAAYCSPQSFLSLQDKCAHRSVCFARRPQQHSIHC